MLYLLLLGVYDFTYGLGLGDAFFLHECILQPAALPKARSIVQRRYTGSYNMDGRLSISCATPKLCVCTALH